LKEITFYFLDSVKITIPVTRASKEYQDSFRNSSDNRQSDNIPSEKISRDSQYTKNNSSKVDSNADEIGINSIFVFVNYLC